LCMQNTFFDSHAHLTHPNLWDQRSKVIQCALDNGISNILSVGYDLTSSKGCLALASEHDCVYAAVGISPHDVSKAQNGHFDRIAELLHRLEVVACGETGLDYHYLRSPEKDHVANNKLMGRC